jgi:hypothetical protein
VSKALPALFRTAARLIDDGREKFCCYAVGRATDTETDEVASAAQNAFHRLFQPPGEPRHAAYFSTDYIETHRRRERRVYALLLAAEIAKDPEDLP